MIALAPDVIKRYPRFHDYDSLRISGLEFARAFGQDREDIRFGVGTCDRTLTESNFEQIRSLVSEILFYRRADTPDTRHPFYRLQAERWLESALLESADAVFPEITPEAVYSQIPVYLDTDPGRVDLLAVDRSGTLVIVEVKVREDPDLPLQAIDYWGRVHTHNRSGDFRRRGYFPGLAIRSCPPKVYLVSPVFSFHDTTEYFMRFVRRDSALWKIGVNQDWRSGVKVIRRLRLL